MPRFACLARVVVAASLVLMLATGCHTTPIHSGSGPLVPLTGPSPSSSVLGPAAAGPLAPVTAPGEENNLVTLATTSARSVETTAEVTGLASISLSGTSVLTATGDVTDHTGRNLGTGTLRAQGENLTVATGAAGMELSSSIRFQPGGVTLNPGVDGSIGLQLANSSASISGTGLTFQPPPATTAPATTAAASAATTTVPPPAAIAGPVTFDGTSVAIGGSSLAWRNPPAAFSVSSGEADLSWAGGGSITAAQGVFQASYLGVRAQQLNATIDRSAAAVGVTGTGLALQVYANGVPQIQVAARIDVLNTEARTGFFQTHPAFIWTPRNLDGTYDMAILSIHPGNAAAAGVHLGLLPMPAMFGGEPHALVGGDTSGLKGGDAIDSLIARNGNDQRSIEAPVGVPIVLVVQGNFAPITVTVTIP